MRGVPPRLEGGLGPLLPAELERGVAEPGVPAPEGMPGRLATAATLRSGTAGGSMVNPWAVTWVGAGELEREGRLMRGRERMAFILTNGEVVG